MPTYSARLDSRGQRASASAHCQAPSIDRQKAPHAGAEPFTETPAASHRLLGPAARGQSFKPDLPGTIRISTLRGDSSNPSTPGRRALPAGSPISLPQQRVATHNAIFQPCLYRYIPGPTDPKRWSLPSDYVRGSAPIVGVGTLLGRGVGTPP